MCAKGTRMHRCNSRPAPKLHLSLRSPGWLFRDHHANANSPSAFARGNSILGTPEGRLDHLYNLEESLNLACLYDPVTNPGGSKVANYMGTTSVARDMVEIVERHGQWREVRAQNSSEAVQERLRWNKGEEPLNYYGLSVRRAISPGLLHRLTFPQYGSLLGQTAAAMQPHRVSRFVLDGIDDPADWWSGRRDRSIVDADAVIGRFFADCALAGPSRCALYAGPSANDTRVRFQSLHDLVAAHSPIPVPGTARVLTLSDLQNQISDLLLYGTSTITWPIFATRAAALAAALSNATSTARINASALSPFLPAHPVFSSATSLPPDTPIDPLNPLSFTHPWASSLSATAPVTCGDTPLRRSKPQFRAWRAALRASNPLAADIWATQSLPCTTWPGRAAWSFAAAHPIASNATAHPLFFLSNVLDPITWSENARAGPQRFPGAAVLLDDAVGHTTVSAPSLCVARALRAYFQRGALPAPGTLCRPLARAFGITEGTEPLGGDATAAERAMAAASETLGVLLASL